MSVKVKEKSIFRKFMIPLLIIMVIQALLFACIFLFGGAIRHLNSNSFDILASRTLSRKNYLQNEMVQHWANLDYFEDTITDKIDTLLTEKGISPAQLTRADETQVLGAVTDDLVSMLRECGVSGTFLILNGQDGSATKSGIYLIDMDPATNSADNSDLLIEYAPSSVTKQLGFPLNSTWSPDFTLDPGDPKSAYYYKAFDAGIHYPDVDVKDLGYWSLPYRVSPDSSQNVISYTRPLRTKDGTVIGVLGTSISTDYIASLLPYEEINMNGKGSYLLGIGTVGSGTLANVLTSGPMAKQFIGSDPTTTLVDKSDYDGIYELTENERVTSAVYANVQPLRLYNTNTPFEQDQWVLSGFIEGRYLLDSSFQVIVMVLISLGAAIVFGLICINVVGRKLTRPISSLVGIMRSSSAQLPVVFPKTHITEIDSLADAVETLNHDVSEAASKLSQIIQAANIPIGAFEFFPATNQVLITGRFFSLFGLPESDLNSYYMPASEFRKQMDTFAIHRERNAEPNTYIYKIVLGSGDVRWLRLKVINKGSASLGVLSDITQETLEKRKIEYERDYDLLTNLLNRRAFHAYMQDLFRHATDIKTAAFMLWDLDNLKYVNDTYGHDYGDTYIRKTADVLKQFMMHNNAIVSRMSGDEFYIFLYGYDSKDEIRRIINTVKTNMDATLISLPGSAESRIHASVGVAWYPDDAANYFDLIKYADFAMYTVKNTGKGRVAEFDRALYNRDAFLLHGNEELNLILEQESVDYAFQPIVNARNGEIFAYEALMRPTSQMLVTPADLLRIAHSQVQLHRVEKLTLFSSMRSFAKYPDIAAKRKIFINTLPSQILDEEDLLAFREEFSGLLDRIVFELMESEHLNESFTAQKLRYVKKWNAQIAIDDYGAGYSNDSALLSIHPDYVKIDMSIIRNIDTDQNRQMLLENLLAYLHNRNILTIAEGVETAAEMRKLITYGIDFMQGFYLGTPELVPAADSPRAEAIRKYFSEEHPGDPVP